MSAVTWAAVLSPAIHCVCDGRETLAMLLVAFRRTTPHDPEITHRGPNVEFPQNLITARVGGEPRHLAGRIVEVAEHDRVSRTRLLAGCFDRAIARDLLARFALGFLDALHAESALFHHAPRTHRDIRVEDEILEDVVVSIIKPIEPPHFVGAVVGAVAGADATVIDLLVQPFVAVHGR